MSKFLPFSPAQAALVSAAAHGLLLLALSRAPFLSRGGQPVVPPSLHMLMAQADLDQVDVRLEVTVIPPLEVEPRLLEADLSEDQWVERASVQNLDLAEGMLDPQSFVAWSISAASPAENGLEVGLGYRSDRNSAQSAPSTRSAGGKTSRAQVTLYKIPSALSVPAAAQAEQKVVPLTAHCPPPDYPALALQRRWQGMSRIWASVSAQGRVLKVRVETSSGYVVLDRAALRAVRGWRFKPALADGKAVAATIVLPIRFQIPGWE